MIDRKLDLSHYILFIFMVIVNIFTVYIAYDRGWNYSWYASRSHWYSHQMLQISLYADDPKDNDIINGHNGIKYKPTIVEDGILLKIVEAGTNNK